MIYRETWKRGGEGMGEMNEVGRADASGAREKKTADIADKLRKVERVVSNLKASRETMSLAERDLMEAENNYKVTKRRFDKGACDSGEVSEALECLTRANVTNYQARYDLQIAMIGLEEILAMDIEAVGEARNLKRRFQDN